MELPVFDNSAGFNEFMQSEFPALADVIPTPRTAKELEENHLSIFLAYQNYNGGKEYQNHFGNGGQGSKRLPTGVEDRLKTNTLRPSDADALRGADLEYYAQQCEQLAANLDDQHLADNAEAGRKRFLEERAVREAYAKTPLVARGQSQAEVEQGRRQAGYTGLAEWQK